LPSSLVGGFHSTLLCGVGSRSGESVRGGTIRARSTEFVVSMLLSGETLGGVDVCPSGLTAPFGRCVCHWPSGGTRGDLVPSGFVTALALKTFPSRSVHARCVGARTSTPRCWARR